MGEISENFFHGRALKSARRNLARQAEIAEANGELEDLKHKLTEKVASQDGAVLDDTKDMDEHGIRRWLRSFLDSKRVGDAAAGDSAATAEDVKRQVLDIEAAKWMRDLASLKSRAIEAVARMRGWARRGGGYDSPISSSKAATIGPIVLTVLVGLFELFQTANWFNTNLSLWMSSLAGTMRTVLPWAAAAVLTTVVMSVTFFAGRKLREGVLARRAARAEGVATGQGSEMSIGLTLVAAAGLLQMVTLGLRFSTDTGDANARAGFMVLGFVSLIGAGVVVIWEYASYTPEASDGVAVFTRSADAATIEDFRFAEYRINAGIPGDLRNLEIGLLRREEAALQTLQPKARELGVVHVMVLNEEIESVRTQIRDLYEKTFTFEPTDLDARAREIYGRSTLGPEAA